MLRIVTFGLTIVVLSVPFLYVMYAAILILQKGYMRPTQGATLFDKSIRKLCFFFLRIVAVFMGIWVPYYVCSHVFAGKDQPCWFLVGNSVIAIQPILSTCIISTKPDAKTYILNLVTMSYCKKKKRAKVENSNPTVVATGMALDANSPKVDTDDDSDPEKKNKTANQPSPGVRSINMAGISYCRTG